jgi:hypothetical protein
MFFFDIPALGGKFFSRLALQWKIVELLLPPVEPPPSPATFLAPQVRVDKSAGLVGVGS